MKKKNFELIEMAEKLKPVLENRDEIGYYAARNFRKINEALTEYSQFKDDLVRKYGEENGNGQIVVEPGSKKFPQFMAELSPLLNIEQEVDIIVCKFEKAIGKLSGAEILAIDWMLED